MDELSGSLSLAVVTLYTVLCILILFGGWRTNSDRHVRLIWVVTLPALAFATFWCTGQWAWTLIYFVTVMGAANSLDVTSKVTASIFAFLMPAILIVRLLGGWISARYCILILSTSFALVLSYGAYLAYESLGK